MKRKTGISQCPFRNPERLCSGFFTAEWIKCCEDSDYPRTMTAITCRMSWDFIGKSPLLTEDEKHRLFHGNAMKFYRFGKLPDLPLIHHMAE